MNIVFASGERYLWADKLCIVQDDTEVTQDLMSKMDAIYAGAVLAIVTLAGADANSNIPGVQRKTRLLESAVRGNGSIKLEVELSIDELFKNTRYEDRAWTFQERILSRRCL